MLDMIRKVMEISYPNGNGSYREKPKATTLLELDGAFQKEPNNILRSHILVRHGIFHLKSIAGLRCVSNYIS